MNRALRTMILAAGLQASACSRAPSPGDKSESIACEVAESYVGSLLDDAGERTFVVSTTDDAFAGDLVRGEWWVVDSKPLKAATKPPIVLLKRLKEKGNRSAVRECPLVRQLLDKHGVKHGDLAVATAIAGKADERFEADIVGISIPVVSAD